MSETITTGQVRFSFAHLFEPYANQQGQEPKYSVTLLIPKNDATTVNAINAAMQQTLQESIPLVFGGQPPANPAFPIYDGDGVRPTGEPFGAECRGHYVMTASSKQQPQVVDTNVQPILDRGAVYSGCYGRASIRFFGYNKAGRKGIGCGLGNVQKLADGEALSGRTTAAQDFGAQGQPAAYTPPQQYAAPAAAAPQQQYAAPAAVVPQQQYVAPAAPIQPQQVPVGQMAQQAPVGQQGAVNPVTGLPTGQPTNILGL